ncbi:WD-40 repeat [hydrothermal vent metagenome]|uniref:WD-40 repeat n=1 Tax=hydrothermal vent metagenome TaxID=652676 RepID=A0A1W1CF55_9ZZZZ
MDALAEYHAIFKLIDFNSLQAHLTAFSIEKKLLAIANNETIYIYNTQTKKQLYRIKSYDGAITQLFFLPHSQHILTATTNGRVILYNYKDTHYNIRIFSSIKKYKTQLPIRISAFALRGRLLAIGSADGKVNLIHRGNYSIIKELHPSSVTIATLCLTDTNRLIIIDIDGEIFNYDLEELEKSQSLLIHLKHTKQLLQIPKSNFLLIHANQNFITLFDIKSYKILRHKYLTFHKNISYMEISEDGNLLVILENREILHITLQNEEKLHSLILHNMIEEAYSFIDDNPQLLASKEYENLEKIYKKKYVNALNALQREEKKKAQKLLENFAKITSKKEDIKLLFRAYSYYERLQTLFLQQSHAPAYALCEKYPPLQYTKEYKAMEEEYKKIYTNAQKQIFLKDTQKAKKLLFPYFTVLSKKESIELILKENRDFLSFLDAIKKRKSQELNKLLAEHPNFSQLAPYKAFIAELDSTLKHINNELNKGAIEKATQMIMDVKEITLTRKEVNFLEKKAKVIQALIQNYKKSQFKRCYEILDAYPEIFLELNLAKMLEKHWNKLMQKCEKYALSGNIQGIKITLKEFLTLKSRAKRVGDILRLTFIVAIDDFISKKKFKSAENFIYYYIDIFGLDTNLQRVMYEYEKKSSKRLALIVQTKRVERDEWLNNKLIVD